jgi:hypothetical protein
MAVIVSRVSGMSFAEFSKQRIFEPLGMTNTQWRDDYTRIVEGRSTAYAVGDDGVSIMRPIEDVHGNGGILTTVGDLLIWNEALEHGRLGGPEFKRMMHHQGQLNDGRQIAYAAGLRVEPFSGVPSVTHTGSTSGYRAFLGRYPEQRLSVAMLCNASNVPTSGSGQRIARVYLGEAARDPVTPAGMDVPTDVLARLEGIYRNTQTGEPILLLLRDGQLRLDGRIGLIPQSPAEFLMGSGDRRLVVRSTGTGGPTLTMFTGEYPDDTFEPVEVFSPTEAELNAYEGEFHSNDAETTFVVGVEDGSLVVTRRPNVTFELSPVYADGFVFAEMGFVRFERDGRGNVVALHLTVSRVYDMRFDRVDR